MGFEIGDTVNITHIIDTDGGLSIEYYESVGKTGKIVDFEDDYVILDTTGDCRWIESELAPYYEDVDVTGIEVMI